MHYDSSKLKLLITVPALNGQGGVASYYNSILPHLPNSRFDIETLEVGSLIKKRRLFHPIGDQINFNRALNNNIGLVHLNPSLGSKSFWRDGLFVSQAKKRKLPVIVFFRGWDNNFEQVVDKYFLPFFRSTYGYAERFIVLSSTFKSKLIQWGVKSAIDVETTTVDENLLANFNLNKKIKNIKLKKNCNILFLSRLEPGKGLLETIDAVKILVDKGLPVKLDIAGDGSMKSRAEQYVSQLKFPKGTIRFFGFVKGQEKVFSFENNHIYCFPTCYGEGLPNSVLEAMAFAMPIVTRPVGGLVDMFEDGKMGYLSKSSSPKEIASCLEKLIINREHMLQIANYNFEQAQEKYLAPKVANRIREIYAKI